MATLDYQAIINLKKLYKFVLTIFGELSLERIGLMLIL